MVPLSARKSALVPSGIVHDAQAKSRKIEKNLKINDEFEYSRQMVENPGDLRVRRRPMSNLTSTMRFILKKGSAVGVFIFVLVVFHVFRLARCDSFGRMIR